MSFFEKLGEETGHWLPRQIVGTIIGLAIAVGLIEASVAEPVPIIAGAVGALAVNSIIKRDDI